MVEKAKKKKQGERKWKKKKNLTELITQFKKAHCYDEFIAYKSTIELWQPEFLEDEIIISSDEYADLLKCKMICDFFDNIDILHFSE